MTSNGTSMRRGAPSFKRGVATQKRGVPKGPGGAPSGGSSLSDGIVGFVGALLSLDPRLYVLTLDKDGTYGAVSREAVAAEVPGAERATNFPELPLLLTVDGPESILRECDPAELEILQELDCPASVHDFLRPEGLQEGLQEGPQAGPQGALTRVDRNPYQHVLARGSASSEMFQTFENSFYGSLDSLIPHGVTLDDWRAVEMRGTQRRGVEGRGMERGRCQSVSRSSVDYYVPPSSRAGSLRAGSVRCGSGCDFGARGSLGARGSVGARGSLDLEDVFVGTARVLAREIHGAGELPVEKVEVSELESWDDIRRRMLEDVSMYRTVGSIRVVYNDKGSDPMVEAARTMIRLIVKSHCLGLDQEEQADLDRLYQINRKMSDLKPICALYLAHKTAQSLDPVHHAMEIQGLFKEFTTFLQNARTATHSTHVWGAPEIQRGITAKASPRLHRLLAQAHAALDAPGPAAAGPAAVDAPFTSQLPSHGSSATVPSGTVAEPHIEPYIGAEFETGIEYGIEAGIRHAESIRQAEAQANYLHWAAPVVPKGHYRPTPPSFYHL